MEAIHHRLTILRSTQPWRVSPNKDINLLPNSAPLTSRRPYKNDREAQTGTRNQESSTEWWPL